MEDKAGPLKCACADCGEVLRYFPAQAGKVVECPKCGEKSRLPPAPTPNPLESGDESEPPKRRGCPVCGTVLGPRDFACTTCEERKRKRNSVLITTGVVAACLIGIVALLLVLRNRQSSQAEARWVPPTISSNLPQPPVKVRTPKSLNDLRVGKFTLTRDPDTGHARIAGDIENTSDNLHRSVTVHIDVLDDQGRKIEELTELITQVPRNSACRVITRSLNPRADDISVSGITEAP